MILYIAVPYTSEDPAVRQDRFDQVTQFCANLKQAGANPLSPITHSHPMALLGTGGSWDTWKEFDIACMSLCSIIVVLKLPGWDKSKGVSEEVLHMTGRGKPAYFADPDNIDVAIQDIQSLMDELEKKKG